MGMDAVDFGLKSPHFRAPNRPQSNTAPLISREVVSCGLLSMVGLKKTWPRIK